MSHILLPILGSLLMLIIVIDVFMTVLYARIGTGMISHWLACTMWWIFKVVTRPLKRRRDMVLSFAGPIILMVIVCVWIAGLLVGGGLIVWPALGSSIRGEDPGSSGFVTALYVAGNALTTAGVSDLAPKTGFYRMFDFVDSFLGIFIITMTVTYFLEIYNALQRRNTFAMKIHMMTDGTADAAELVAELGADGQFQAGYQHLVDVAAEMVSFEEAHHFYSVLLYFRFQEPHYALSRLALVTLDMITLIKSALDDDEYTWLKTSAATTQIWRSTMHMLTQLAQAFLPEGLGSAKPSAIDDTRLERWRQRYFAACRRLRQAGIKTAPDEQTGAENYIALRERWDRYVTSFAQHMAHDMSVIDPAGDNPQRADERPEFTERLRGVG